MALMILPQLRTALKLSYKCAEEKGNHGTPPPPPNRHCHEKPATARGTAEFEKKRKKQRNRLELQDNTRPKSIKSRWFVFPLVMHNISEFLPALELWCLIRGSL